MLAAGIASPRLAYAREAPSVDDQRDEDPELGDLEQEALGTRGLLRTRAESVSFDAEQKILELSGNVRVDAPPFHLRSQHIKLSRTRYGIEVDGTGRLAFCPCLGTPLTVEFEKAIVAPPGELFIKSPKLELYGVPVFYLPWFWLRSDEKVGLLPPDIAYRGQDGFYAGAGVHLPWKDPPKGGVRQSIDLRGGAYFLGGFALDARLRSPNATTKIRYDRLPGARAPVLLVPGSSADTKVDDGLLVDARGAANDSLTTIAWDADVLRGRRGVAATTDLDAASKPWDRAAASASVRVGPIIGETGARAVTRRGGDLVAVEAAGPFAAFRSSGGTSGITYDATVEGGTLRTSGAAASAAALASPAITPDAVSYARTEIGALAATTFGPIAASLHARGAGDVASEGRRYGFDRAGLVRLRVASPLARAFATGDDDDRNDPLVHVVEPFVEAAALHTKSDAILESLPGRGLASLSGTAPVVDGGLSTTLGRWGKREAIELMASSGAALDHVSDGARGVPLARARLSATFVPIGAQLETGHVMSSRKTETGSAVVARLRLGRVDGPRVLANIATREGIDPILARAITEAPIESPAGFLAAEGTTGGAMLFIPWARAIATSVGADGDATAAEIVAARAGLELRDRCGCVTLRANGAHRIGRSGVDVWIGIDFAADR